MRTFDEIFAIAADRQGGTDVLEGRLAEQPHGNPHEMTEKHWLA